MSDSLLTVKKAAEYLDISVYSVYRYTEKNELPHIKKRFGLRFRKEDLDVWLDKDKRKPLSLLCLSQEKLTPPNISLIRDMGGVCELAKSKSKTRFNFGFGAIYQRKTKSGRIRWYIEYRDAIKRRIQKVATLATTKEEAALALREELARTFNKEYGIEQRKEKIGFKEFSQIYRNDYLTAERKNCRSDKYRLGKLDEFFKDTELKEITPQMIRKLKNARLNEGNSERTINRYLALLKRMFNVAMEDGYVRENPVKKVKFFSENDTQRERVLTYEEEERFLAQCAEHLRPIIVTALHTGMRISEILGLKFSSVNLLKKEIKVEKTKSKKVRFIPINNDLFEELERLKKECRESYFIFPFRSIRTAFENARRRANISDLTFHDLRRTFGTRLLEKGVDIVTIQKLYGHSNPLVTQRYLHPSDEIKKEAVELLNKNHEESAKKEGKPLHIRYTEKEKSSEQLINQPFSVN